MEEILNQIAEQTGVPADLLDRSARARAGAAGKTVEAVLQAWAGGEPEPVSVAEPVAESEPDAAPKLPEHLLRRTAAAKAKRSGRPLDEILAEMGLTPEVTAEAAPAPVSAPAPAASNPEPESAPVPDSEPDAAPKLPEHLLRRTAAAKAKRSGRPLDEVLAEMGLAPEAAAEAAPAPVSAPAPAASSPEPESAPAPDSESEPAPESEPEPAPAFSGFPRWLAASFIIIPLIALLYAGLAPNGPDCGSSGQLAVNPVTGEAEACGGDVNPFFTLGETIYGANCAACHGTLGEGSVGPAFANGAVVETFGSCDPHLEWVTLGTNGWPDATYGDTAKPVGGGGIMPEFGSSLSERELAAVVLFERVEFGGEDITAAETSCGLLAEG